MCGICGVVGRERVDKLAVLRMRETLSHRGPDDAGLYCSSEGNIILAHRRLSILDLTPAGRQPMSNEDGTVWVSYNGEIYNFLELKSWLEERGHRFRSRCDTEVIVHLYEELGDGFPKKLDGQFAIALWDEQKNILFLIRDRVGKKPLYYLVDREKIVFASEIKAILEYPGTEKEIDLLSLDDYLTFQYVPNPNTIFKQIKKVPPAHILRYHNGTIHMKQYWKLHCHNGVFMRKDEYYEEYFGYLLRSAVKKRLLSDVPLGVFLSGGIDSSTIVAMMSELNEGKVRTFSVGFQDEEFNELEFANLVAQRFDTQHEQIILDPSSAEDLIPDIAKQFDEPLADQAAVPTYLMSKIAKNSVSVCLSGEGGDEVFSGYDRYDIAIERQQLLDSFIQVNPKNKRLLQSSLAPSSKNYVETLCAFSAEEKEKLLRYEVYRFIRRERDGRYPHMERYFRECTSDDYLTRLQWVDIHTYLTDNLLVKVDRASMLASLEVRAPFLDTTLIEEAIGLPRHLKVRGGVKKYLLRSIMGRVLPNQILWRPEMGFSIPLKKWFKEDLREYTQERLLGEERDPFFNKSFIQRLLNDDWIDKPRQSLKVWTLLIFKEWREQYGV